MNIEIPITEITYFPRSPNLPIFPHFSIVASKKIFLSKIEASIIICVISPEKSKKIELSSIKKNPLNYNLKMDSIEIYLSSNIESGKKVFNVDGLLPDLPELSFGKEYELRKKIGGTEIYYKKIFDSYLSMDDNFFYDSFSGETDKAVILAKFPKFIKERILDYDLLITNIRRMRFMEILKVQPATYYPAGFTKEIRKELKKKYFYPQKKKESGILIQDPKTTSYLELYTDSEGNNYMKKVFLSEKILDLAKEMHL